MSQTIFQKKIQLIFQKVNKQYGGGGEKKVNLDININNLNKDIIDMFFKKLESTPFIKKLELTQNEKNKIINVIELIEKGGKVLELKINVSIKNKNKKIKN